MRAKYSALALYAFVVACVSNCSGYFLADDCETLRTCSDSSAGTKDAGVSGAGLGGEINVGGTGGAGGTNSPAGASGSSGADPCGAACSAPTPICKLDTRTCVECTDKSECSVAKPVCDALTNKCVECAANTDCAGDTPLCNTATNTCVACLSQTDCKDAKASQCIAGECKPCATNDHCKDILGKSICDASECVQCTGKQFTACGEKEGTPLVCESLKKTCSANQQQSAGLCQPCVSDAQCKPGQLCVLQKFGTPAQDVGYFCFWKEADAINGTPTNCLPDGRPYVKQLENASSIDGSIANICGLAATTCIGHNQYRSKDCTKDAKPDDSLCGFSAGKDSKCVKFGGTHRCTIRCLSYDDCDGDPGVDDGACDTGSSPKICKL